MADQTYKRLEFDHHGKPADVLHIKTITGIPIPKDDEVVIKVSASPVHPSVLMSIQGLYGTNPKDEKFPAVPGNEGVGIVHAVGANVELKVGQRVCFVGGGIWSEYVVLNKAGTILPVPDAVPDEFAAQFFVNPLTAQVMLLEVLRPKQGEWVIQSAAGSTLGRMAIQIAKYKGINLINLVRRQEQADELKQSLGQDVHVVVFDGKNTAEAVKHIQTITNGKGINYGLDAVAGTVTDLMVKAAAHRATILVYGVLDSDSWKLSPGEVLFKEAKIHGFWLAKWFTDVTPAVIGRVIGEMFQWMATKVVTPVTEATFPFSEYAAAIERSVKTGKGGKVLIKF
jgi:NADPH:quinone reductase-like Zn-dependent oxidoreductase